MINKLVILLTLFSFVAYAGDVTHIEKDTPAPYTGYLFTPEKTNEVKNVVVERDGLLKLNESLTKSLQLQSDIAELNQKKVNILLQQQEDLSKTLYDQRSMSNLERMLWVGAGILIVGVSIYGVSQIPTK